MEDFTKEAKDKRKKPNSKAELLVGGTGAGLSVAGGKKFISSAIQRESIRTPTAYLYGGAKGASGGFEAQSAAIKETLENADIKVR